MSNTQKKVWRIPGKKVDTSEQSLILENASLKKQITELADSLLSLRKWGMGERERVKLFRLEAIASKLFNWGWMFEKEKHDLLKKSYYSLMEDMNYMSLEIQKVSNRKRNSTTEDSDEEEPPENS